jgi:hypothetical protein
MWERSSVDAAVPLELRPVDLEPTGRHGVSCRGWLGWLGRKGVGEDSSIVSSNCRAELAEGVWEGRIRIWSEERDRVLDPQDI